MTGYRLTTIRTYSWSLMVFIDSGYPTYWPVNCRPILEMAHYTSTSDYNLMLYQILQRISCRIMTSLNTAPEGRNLSHTKRIEEYVCTQALFWIRPVIVWCMHRVWRRKSRNYKGISGLANYSNSCSLWSARYSQPFAGRMTPPLWKPEENGADQRHIRYLWSYNDSLVNDR